MKKLTNIGKSDKEVLMMPLEAISPRAVNTIGDLRSVDKICSILESDATVIEFEDVDFRFLKSKFDSFSDWNPAPEARTRIISVADKLLAAEKEE